MHIVDYRNRLQQIQQYSKQYFLLRNRTVSRFAMLPYRFSQPHTQLGLKKFSQ